MNTMSMTTKFVNLNTGGNGAEITINAFADWAELNKRDRYFVSYLFDLIDAYQAGTLTSDTAAGERKMDLGIGDIVMAAKKVTHKNTEASSIETDTDVPF